MAAAFDHALHQRLLHPSRNEIQLDNLRFKFATLSDNEIPIDRPDHGREFVSVLGGQRAGKDHFLDCFDFVARQGQVEAPAPAENA